MRLKWVAALALAASCSRESAPPPLEPDRHPSAKPAASEKPSVKKYPISMSEEEWRRRLTPEQYRVLRQRGTEPQFCPGYKEIENQGKGSYACAACGNVLFGSETKFHSGTGWPSFNSPFKEGSVEKIRDLSYGMDRVEVVCSQCGSHLGHVFSDGPPPTGERFCMNAICLKFVGEKEEKK